jgi:hypothetical protein
MSTEKTTKKPANRRLVFTMGGKGGAGKTTVIAAIVSHLREQGVPFDLFDADVENDKRGNLKLYFPEAEKVSISTERGLDLFVDRLFGGSHSLAVADLGAGAGADTFPWFDKMHHVLAQEGVLFTAVGVFVRDPASVETIFSWASKLRDRVSYLIVKNERDSEDFPYFDDTPEGAKFRELAHPTIIRFEKRETDIQHELNAWGITLEQAVSATHENKGAELKRYSTLMRMKGLKARFEAELEKAHDLLLP